MNRRSFPMIVAVTIFGLALGIGHAAAQSAKQLVGTWSLVSADAFGTSPLGLFMFDRGGHFSTILMRAGLPKYASNNRSTGTADENKAVVQGSIAYFGTYKLNGKNLNLHIEGSTFPNWTGTDQTRTDVSVTATEMKYTQPTPSAGGPAAVVVWKRVK